MDEMLDMDELIALQEEEQKLMEDEDEEQDLEVLREWEAEQEAKENKFKKALFQSQEVQEKSQEEVRF